MLGVPGVAEEESLEPTTAEPTGKWGLRELPPSTAWVTRAQNNVGEPNNGDIV